MPGDSSIIAYFGGDTTDLKRASEEAGVIVKGFGRQASLAFKEIAAGFIGAVIVAEAVRAFKELATEAIDSAEKSRDALEKLGEPIPHNVEALASLGDAFKSAKSFAVDMVSSILVGYVDVKSAVRGFIDDALNFTQSEQDAMNNVAQTAQRTIDAIAAARKKYIDELPAKEAEAEKQLADLRAKNTAAQQSAASNLRDITQKIADVDTGINNTIDGTLRNTQLRVEREKLIGDQIKYQADVTKEAATQEALLAKVSKDREDALGHAIDEALNKLPDVTEEWTKQQFLTGAISKNLVDWLGFGPKIVDWQNQSAVATEKAADAAQKEADALAKAADAADRKARSLNANGYGGGSQYGEASDATLQQIIQSNRRDLVNINTDPSMQNLASDYAKAYDQGRIDAAQKELDFRSKLRTDASAGGEDYARSQFQGDPLQFEKIYQQIVGTAGGGLGVNQQAQQAVIDIAQLLKTNFGNP